MLCNYIVLLAEVLWEGKGNSDPPQWVYTSVSINPDPCMVGRVQSSSQQGRCHHSSCDKGFGPSHRELGNQDGLSGVAWLKARGLNLCTHPPASHLILTVPRKAQDCGRAASFSWHGFPKSNSAESLQSPPTSAAGQGSGRTASTRAHLSFMSGIMAAIVFPPWGNGLAWNGSYSGQWADCRCFQQKLFQRSVGRREESRHLRSNWTMEAELMNLNLSWQETLLSRRGIL